MATFRYIVKDVGESVEFYCDQLGFELDQDFRPAMAIVTLDDLQLWLAGPSASASRPMPDGAKPEPGGWARIVITVDDLDMTVADFKSAGIPFRNEIVAGPGGRQILCEDPSGNAIELFEASS